MVLDLWRQVLFEALQDVQCLWVSWNALSGCPRNLEKHELLSNPLSLDHDDCDTASVCAVARTAGVCCSSFGNYRVLLCEYVLFLFGELLRQLDCDFLPFGPGVVQLLP